MGLLNLARQEIKCLYGTKSKDQEFQGHALPTVMVCCEYHMVLFIHEEKGKISDHVL